MKIFQRKTIPAALAVVAILAYGLLIPWMGFYWDDWVFAWLLHFRGAFQMAASFFQFDPLIPPVFFITTSLLGESLLAWQLFALVVRVVMAVSVLWSLNQVWPKFPRQATWVAFFFLVYPGFGQQWVAFTHSNQEWVSLTCFIFSLGLTARALRPGATAKVKIAALALQAVGLMTTEYFLGLEIMRPLIIWYVLGESIPGKRARAMQTLRAWAGGPLLVWFVAGFGQFLFHRSPWYNGHPFEIGNPFSAGIPAFVVGAFNELVNTLATSVFSAWTQSAALLVEPYNALADWLQLGLVLVSLGLVFFYLARIDPDYDQPSAGGQNWAGQAMALGLVGILAGRGPSLLAGMPVSLKFDWDRLLVGMMLGVSLLLIGLLDYFVRDDRRKIFLVSLLVAVSIGGQFHTANAYRRSWADEQAFFRQLGWRMPGLKPGTALLTNELPFGYVSDFQLTAPLNWIYAPKWNGEKLPYVLLFTKSRLGSGALPSLAPGVALQTDYRANIFDGSTSDMVVFFAPSDGCLRVLDATYGTASTVPGRSYLLTDAIPLSNLGRIETGADSAPLPPQYFGSENKNTWCYFYEKAELARQASDWNGVKKLFKQAGAAGFGPLLAAENLVFIEADARTGDLPGAARLAQAALKGDPALCPALRQVWERAAAADPSAPAQNPLTKMLDSQPACK